MAKACRTLFLGTDGFALICLKKLVDRSKHPGSCISGIEVVNLKPKTKKQPASAVQKYARANGLIMHAWPPLASHIVDRFDTAAVVSFGALLPDYFLDLFPLPCVNVHPSLLPRWRGASPLAHTIMAGDMHAGVTLLQVSKRKFDVGPILMQEACQIEEDTDVTDLTEQLATIGSEMLVKCLENYEHYVEQARPQDSGGVWAQKISSDMALVRWPSMTAEAVIRRQRALCDRYTLKSSFDSIPLRLIGIGNLSDVVEDVNDFIPAGVESTPGVVFHRSDSNFLCIRCKEGWVTVEALFAYGENETIPAEDFALDHLEDYTGADADADGDHNSSGVGNDNSERPCRSDAEDTCSSGSSGSGSSGGSSDDGGAVQQQNGRDATHASNNKSSSAQRHDQQEQEQEQDSENDVFFYVGKFDIV